MARVDRASGSRRGTASARSRGSAAREVPAVPGAGGNAPGARQRAVPRRRSRRRRSELEGCDRREPEVRRSAQQPRRRLHADRPAERSGTGAEAGGEKRVQRESAVQVGSERTSEGRQDAVSLLLYAIVAIAFAQTETGRISGTAFDPQHMAVPGVRVVATSLSTGAVRATATDAAGAYVLANLPAASYEITFEFAGFKTARTRAQLSVGASLTIDASLELGDVVETISVAAAPERINTRTPEVATTINQSDVAALPTLTRNPYDFVALGANVTFDDQAVARGAGGFSINGQRAASTNVLLDGAANNDEFTASVGEPVPLDAVQELSVITSNFSAQYGRATGGIVNVVTKSGSNEFHGTADYFFRNEKTTTQTVDQEARGIERSPFSRHQPSFSLGGPIRRNVAQFFLAGEYIRVRSTKTDVAWAPTASFLSHAAPATQAYFARFPSTGTPTGIFYTPPGAVAPVLEQVLYNVASDVGAGSPQNTLALVGRVDWTIGANANAYVRYALHTHDLLSRTT